MRAVHVSHSALPGGSNEVLLSLLRHRPAGVECACVFLEPGPLEQDARALGAETAVVATGRARQLWRAPMAVATLRRAVRSLQADLVMAHVSKAHLYSAPVARLEGLPYIWRQPERRGQKPLMHAVAGRLPADAIVCSSDFTAEEQSRRSRGTPVHRVHPGRETDPLPRPRRHRAGAGERVVVGIVGRLQRWKRVELALRALPVVRRTEPGVGLRIVGDAWPGLDDDYPDALRTEAARLGIADAVQFSGHVPGAAAAMADLDLLVHTADREPFGLVMVEAMLCGVPVVASRTGGPAEIVRDGVDGLLVDVEDPNALAEAILQLARDPGRRATMGAAARERALARFTADRMAGELWDLAREVADQRDGRAA